MLIIKRICSTEKSNILSTQIQMNEAKNTVGNAKLSSRWAMHRFASKRDCDTKKQRLKCRERESTTGGSHLSEERHQGDLGSLGLGAAVVDLEDDQEHLHQAQHAGHQSIQLHLHLQRIKLFENK